MLLALAAVAVSLVAPPPAEAPVERVAFGSCIQESRPVPAFDAIRDYDPDTLVLLGDNVYGDTADVNEMAEHYEALGRIPGFQALRDSARLLYVWDDHDYGQNDAGSEWPHKAEMKRAMLDFFGEPADSERRTRPGNYGSVTLGPVGQRVQFILLDTRWFRSALKRDPDAPKRTYLPDDSDEATVLGEDQWDWLENELKKPADVRVICTSIQVLAYEHRFEKWGNFPKERQRLLDLLEPLPDAMVISGDRHSGEISLFDYPDGRVLAEVTSSALNQTRKDPTGDVNPYREGTLVLDANFGTIDFDWQQRVAYLSLRSADGRVLNRVAMKMAAPE